MIWCMYLVWKLVQSLQIVFKCTLATLTGVNLCKLDIWTNCCLLVLEDGCLSWEAHKDMMAAHYLPSLLCLVAASWHKKSGGFLFKALFDPCKLLYALKSRINIAQVGQQTHTVRMTGELQFFMHIELHIWWTMQHLSSFLYKYMKGYMKFWHLAACRL